MSARFSSASKFLALCVLCTLLGACGNKGELYLSDDVTAASDPAKQKKQPSASTDE